MEILCYAQDDSIFTFATGLFQQWFAARGWSPFAHQSDILEAAHKGESALLIAPTGGGKTLAGFLPSLVDLQDNGGGNGLHTLYIPPLKALAVDIQRNLETPVAEMGLDIRLETRTGDTPNNRRRRQRKNPPDILMTTPESLALKTMASLKNSRITICFNSRPRDLKTQSQVRRGNGPALYPCIWPISLPA